MIGSAGISRAAAMLIAVAACRNGAPLPTNAPDADAPKVAAIPSGHDARLPRGDRDLPTTSAPIFFGNLDGQVQRARDLLVREPSSAARERDLGVILYARAKHHNDLEDLARALAHVSKAIERDPKDAAAYVARANQLQTVHRFEEARKDLERARTLGASPADVDALVVELDYVQGQYAVPIAAVRKAAADHPTSSTVARLGLLEHDLGNIAEADRLMSQAEKLVRDPSPIPVAWLNLQRGIHAYATGDLERAEIFFREAIRRIPGYVAAEEHLAETLHEVGRTEEAIALYEGIVARSTDPEFKGALGALYRLRGRTKEADALIARATADYDTLLKRFPEAMYWHASEFFAGEGKSPRRALELLTKNAALRPGQPSLVALARAQLANGDAAHARATIRKALATPLVSAEMFVTASRIEEALGAKAEAEALRAKARAINPRSTLPPSSGE